MRHIERRLSVALFLGKNSSTLGGCVCINRVECEFPFSTFFFFLFPSSLPLFLSFSPSPSFLSFSLAHEWKRAKRKREGIFIYTVERLTHVHAYDRRILFMREARRQTEDWKKIWEKIRGDRAWRWFNMIPFPSLSLPAKKILADPDSLSSP